MRLRIRTDGVVIASAPTRISDTELSKFVRAQQVWIEKKLRVLAVRKSRIKQLGMGTRAEYQSLKESARTVATHLIEKINTQYGFSFRKISIRNQKSRWGSCSSKGDLSFNYRIALLPEDLAEYLVTHELCHLGELNHSTRFWKLVEQTIPDWKRKRTKLHQYGLSEQ